MTGIVGGSQIDVIGLVSQLVAAERAPQDAQIKRQSERITTQISAVGSLMGALSTFRSSLASLRSVDVFAVRSVSSSDKEALTATATTKAMPGSYQVEILQLAKAQQLTSNAFANGQDEAVGTGTLTLSLGTKSFSVEIDDSNSTLAGIRDAINAAADNPGIRATLVHGSDGTRLVLSSAHTGAENTIEVTHSGGDGGLVQLAHSAATPGNYTEIAAAQDAVVRVAGAEMRSATNSVANAIDGVTLTLAKETDGEPVTLSIGYDNAAVTTRINNFVSAYNNLVTQIARLRSYDAASGTAGPMLGDSLVTGIEAQLRRLVASPVGGQPAGFDTLAAIGITTQMDGTLSVDNAKLQKALDNNFEAVGKLFGSQDGVAARLHTQADELLKSGAGLDARSQGLAQQQKALDKRMADLDTRMAVVQAAYIRQFTALDTLLSQLQVTSSYMSQQFQSLHNLANGGK